MTAFKQVACRRGLRLTEPAAGCFSPTRYAAPFMALANLIS